DALAVLARARLGLFGVDDEETRPAVLALLGHERPLEPGREPCPATPTQARGLDLLDDRVLADLHQLLGLVPVTTRLRGLQAPVLVAVAVGKDAVLVAKHQPNPPDWGT